MGGGAGEGLELQGEGGWQGGRKEDSQGVERSRGRGDGDVNAHACSFDLAESG